MSTLVIENVKDEFLPAFKALSKAMNAKCRVEKAKSQNLQNLKKGF